MKLKHLAPRFAIANLVGLSVLAAFPAQATLISGTLTAATSASADGAAADVLGPLSNSTYVSSNSYSSGANSSSGASAWGNASGTYRAGSDGNGVFNSTGRFQREVQLTNNNGFSTDYSLNFFIYYGNISASTNGATGSGYGSYDLSIKQNNSTTLFTSGARVNSDGTIVKTGTELNNASFSGSAAGGYYSWGGTYVTLNLGTLANGASTKIDFDLVSTAFGNYGTVNGGSNGGYGGYGGYCGEFAAFALIDGGYGGECTVTGSVYGGLGDPFDFVGNTGDPSQPPLVVNEQRTPGQVPIPGTLPLLALGLAGLAYSRKYRLR